MATKQHFLIIGNSGAAIQAVKGIRSVDRESKITLVSKESGVAYAPVITTYLLGDIISPDQCGLVDRDFYQKNQVEFRPETLITALDTKGNKASVSSGEVIHYDKLLVATGASPQRLNVTYPEDAPVYGLRTLDDAVNIKKHLQDDAEIIFCGAGLVSLQIANAISPLVKKMTFLVGSNQVLSQNVDSRCSALLRRKIEAGPNNIHFNTTVVGVEKGPRNKGVVVYTDAGDQIQGGMLIVGKGVRPNLLAEEPGGALQTNRGILVNHAMQTSSANVFAAGDVCEAPELLTGQSRMIATWPNACQQGWIAGVNLAGGSLRYPGSLAMNVTKLFGHAIASVGNIRPGGGLSQTTAEYWDESKKVYKKWFFTSDWLFGAIFYNDLTEVSLAAQAIRNNQPIERQKRILTAKPWAGQSALGELARSNWA